MGNADEGGEELSKSEYALGALQNFKLKQRDVLYNKLLEKALTMMAQKLIWYFEIEKLNKTPSGIKVDDQ